MTSSLWSFRLVFNHSVARDDGSTKNGLKVLCQQVMSSPFKIYNNESPWRRCYTGQFFCSLQRKACHRIALQVAKNMLHATSYLRRLQKVKVCLISLQLITQFFFSWHDVSNWRQNGTHAISSASCVGTALRCTSNKKFRKSTLHR